jgi:hypothetical protein
VDDDLSNVDTLMIMWPRLDSDDADQSKFFLWQHAGDSTLSKAPFACVDKPAEKYRWLIYCERKILF